MLGIPSPVRDLRGGVRLAGSPRLPAASIAKGALDGGCGEAPESRPTVAGARRGGAVFALPAGRAGGVALAGRDRTPDRGTVAEFAVGETPPLDFDASKLGRSPLLVPRDFSAGFIPELLDLDQLFRDTEFRVDPSGERLARLLAFPRSHGDAIVLDDVDGYPLDLLFDDALVADSIASVPDGLTDAFGLGPIGGSIPLGNRVRFDDFPGSEPDDAPGGVIPEPATGFLFALGLGALGIRRRRLGELRSASPRCARR